MMAPAFEQAAATLEPRVRLLKLNTEKERPLAAELNIRSIPTLALFEHGKEVNRVSGVMDAAAIAAWVQRQL
jgi:thioredoxin 2